MIIQLSFNNFAEKLVMPVNPPEIIFSGGGTSFNDFVVVKGGDTTVIGDKQFQAVSFSSFFPRDYDSFLCEYVDIPKPWEAVRMIERWRASKWPARLIIADGADGPDINMPVTIRQFDKRDMGGQPGDVSYDIAFTEFRFVKIREVIEETAAVVAAEQRPDMAMKPGAYTVVAGDNLTLISKRFYGNSGQWSKIYDANKSIIGKDPNTIIVGQKLVIP